MRRLVLLGLTAITLVPPVLAAQQTGRVQFETYTLSNGLRVILSEDHSTPVVTVDVWYYVGSRNEQRGRSGFAHLFEHMMFQGSAHVKKGEHFQLIERAGGNMNGTTNEDRTDYFETLPSNRLNLGLWLEADRMRTLSITPENFENQRQVVKEERRLRVDNQPYGRAFTDGLTLPFDSTACFPYSHSVIGSMDDLNAAKVEDVQAFFDLYYAPNNATLTVVGDFVTADAKQLIQEYFGDIKRGAEAPAVGCDVRYGGGAKASTFEDEHANLPAVVIAYRIPPHSDTDTRALDLVGTILGAGESSRLNRALVRDAKSALQTFAGSDSRRGSGLFLAFAIANQGVTADTLARQLEAQVARIVSEGVTAEELEKARNDFRSSNIFGRQTTFAVAERLQHYAHYHGALEDIHTDLDAYMTVTTADVQRVVRKYFTAENSYTITVIPKAQAPGGGQ